MCAPVSRVSRVHVVCLICVHATDIHARWRGDLFLRFYADSGYRYPEICPSTTCLQPLNVANNQTFAVIEALLVCVRVMALRVW